MSRNFILIVVLVFSIELNDTIFAQEPNKKRKV